MLSTRDEPPSRSGPNRRLRCSVAVSRGFIADSVAFQPQVEGELWGNVYPMNQNKASECIVRINATSGKVLGWINMRGLLAKQIGARVQLHSLGAWASRCEG